MAKRIRLYMTRKNRNGLTRFITMVLIALIAGLSDTLFFESDMITGIIKTTMCLSVAVYMNLK